MAILTCHDGDAGDIEAIPPAAGKVVGLLHGWLGHGDKGDSTDGDGNDSDEVKYPWPASVLDKNRTDDKPKYYGPGK